MGRGYGGKGSHCPMLLSEIVGLRDVSLFSGGGGTTLRGRVIIFFPLVWGRVIIFFKVFLGVGHNFFKKFFY